MAKADFPKAKTEFPSTSMDIEAWVAGMDAKPDVMWTILADVYNVIIDERERDAGVRRMGRRPFRSASSLEELMTTVFPERYSLEPLTVTLPKLIGVRSQRAFAMKIPMNQSNLSRLLSGERTADMPTLEAIARAAKVAPTYFPEYRALLIAQVITEVLAANPNLSITAIKRMRVGVGRAA